MKNDDIFKSKDEIQENTVWKHQHLHKFSLFFVVQLKVGFFITKSL